MATKTRVKTAVAAPEPCPACEGSGETPQPVNRRRGTIRGQMGVCLSCLGTGEATDQPVKTTFQPYHP